MRVRKKQNDAMSGILIEDERTEVKQAIPDDGVKGWSVLYADGNVVTGSDISEKASAVCANIIDLAMQVGVQLGDDAPRPSLTFSKKNMVMYTHPIADANLLVVRDKSSGFRAEFS